MYRRVQEKQKLVTEALEYFHSTFISPKDVNEFLKNSGSNELRQSDSLSQLLKRNELNLPDLLEIEYFNESAIAAKLKQNKAAARQAEIELKYEGYIQRQIEQAENFAEVEKVIIPEGFDFTKVKSFSAEGREKLIKVRPRSIGQASRISGVSPSDISILTIYMKG